MPHLQVAGSIPVTVSFRTDVADKPHRQVALAVQAELLKICINSPDGEKDAYEDSEYKHATVPAGAEAHEEDHHRRRLMASGGGHSCPEGQEPIWESDLIHKAHILIFLIAACYIAYAMVSIALSMLAMRRWHKFEQRVSGGELLPLPLGGLQHHGESSLIFGLRQCLRQFSRPLDVATYSALRALFVGRVNVRARHHLPLITRHRTLFALPSPKHGCSFSSYHERSLSWHPPPPPTVPLPPQVAVHGICCKTRTVGRQHSTDGYIIISSVANSSHHRLFGTQCQHELQE